jgi:hypothetical protein
LVMLSITTTTTTTTISFYIFQWWTQTGIILISPF